MTELSRLNNIAEELSEFASIIDSSYNILETVLQNAKEYRQSIEKQEQETGQLILFDT
jgi:hypothetical protein